MQILLEQGRLIRATYGMDAKGQADADALSRKLFEILRDEAPDKAKVEIDRLLTEYDDARGLPRSAVEAQTRLLASDWFRLFLTYEPSETLRLVTCPVLAVGGSKDLQVPAEENLAAIKAALSGNKDVTIEELPGLNHLFQDAKTGSPLEYGTIEETMSPVALNLISAWIATRITARDLQHEPLAAGDH